MAANRPGDRYNLKVTDNFVSLTEIGDSVQGTLIGIGRQVFSDARGERTVGRYTVDDEGVRKSFLGSQQIDYLLGGRDIGYAFRLEYIGDSISKAGYKVKQFDLYEAAE